MTNKRYALGPREGYLSESQLPLCIKDPADLQADRLWKVEGGYKKTLRSCLLLPLRVLLGTDGVAKTDEFKEHFQIFIVSPYIRHHHPHHSVIHHHHHC